MSKSSYGPPPAAPPSYDQAVGGVPPSSPLTPGQPLHTCSAPSYGFAVGSNQPPMYSNMHSQPYGVQPRAGPVLVTTVVPLGSQPTHMICPHCHAEIDTATKSEPGMIAYLSAAVICLFGFWLGCCLIPCCIPDCMDTHHSCPHCKAYLGRYRR